MRAKYSTRARGQIAQILKNERRYLSAQDVYARLAASRDPVSLATVYRTLGLLEERGEASSRIDAHGESTYVSCAPTHHHHAICRACGKVEEVGCQALDRMADALNTYHGFQLDDHTLEFFGRCSSCG